jgi:aconitate hydratase
MSNLDPFQARDTFDSGAGPVGIYRLSKLEAAGLGKIARLPFSIRVLLESVLRHCDGFEVTEEDIRNLAGWNAKAPARVEFPFKPARVVLQDFTGVPAVVDLAAMRSAMERMGGDPTKINPLVPADLVVDHSVQVDRFNSADALQFNVDLEFQRNRERYELLRWAQKSFDGFRVVPPNTGIVHQVNLEYLAQGVFLREDAQGPVAVPDSLVGTDSHTTMINGLGVVGWGVGGIEAEAVMLGQPLYMLLPEVVGFELSGALPPGATATDLVLTVVQVLRREGVVGKFVEFFGPGVSTMSLADRATIANMAPEYGATMGFFPIDQVSLDYLRLTGRSDDVCQLVERYTKEQGLWRNDDDAPPEFTKTVSLDMSTVEPSLAGPKRPQDRIALSSMKSQWKDDLTTVFGKSDPRLSPEVRWEGEGGHPAGSNGGPVPAAEGASEPAAQTAAATLEGDPGFGGMLVEWEGESFELKHGDVVIAAITSCTNTSNPSVMLAAGLLARNAVKRGLKVPPYVKTSLAPGSRVVTDYLEKAELDDDLEAAGFYTVGYGCTTCIGNSGPLPEPIARAVAEGDLVASAVLSGNRNFEGRINPHVKANYLASPPLVVAFALAGTTDIDLTSDPIGQDTDGNDVMLSEIWPTHEEINETVRRCVEPEMFRNQYDNVWEKNQTWNDLPVGDSALYDWNAESTYVQEPPFLIDLPVEPAAIQPITSARVLALLGDSITTDHISPAGAIAKDGPAGLYLQSRGVEPRDFNSFGSRRGNDRVMTRGTFANIRIRNQLAPGTEGGVTRHLPDGEVMSIYEAATMYRADGVPLVVLAGKEYGTGSSRDWAAKGTLLLGVRAVIASSYERIHRSNLVGMGVLPLEFVEGESWRSLGLTGEETYDFAGLDDDLQPGAVIQVAATAASGKKTEFKARVRIDTPVEMQYYQNGGILQTVLRKLLKAE